MEFRILGPLEAIQDGRSVELGGPLEKALLARLLIDAGRTVSVERLIEDIWEGEAPGSASVSIRVRVSRLRKVLASAGSSSTIETKAGGYSFVPSPQDIIDIDEFQARHQAARSALAEADFRLGLSELEVALTAWRGPPLTGMGEPPFAAAERTRLVEARLAAIEDKIDAGLASGKHSVYINELEALVSEFPLRERIWAQLMTALYRGGRQADALAAFKRLREMLNDQLGIDPSPELSELETKILQQSPHLTLHALPVVQDRVIDLPSGVVTFLLTDIEGSSEMWGDTSRSHASSSRPP